MASRTDIQVASLAAGFTIGFGFLTVWTAIQQTRKTRNPARSSYIYMVWGEIVANLAIGIIGWLFLDGTLGPTVPVLFFILFLWVFEIQLLMQIIINRIAVIAESRKTIKRLKWGTAVVITLINIAVFCIWIPAHLVPPVSQTFVNVNYYWDRVSKVLILLVDAGLNWYFLRIVKVRLLSQHGLVKYKPLVGFNAKLMVVSIAMDVMLLGLMSLPNQVVYIQFHPVAYMVKLNIEMSMASLITRLAREQHTGFDSTHSHSRDHHSHPSRVSRKRDETKGAKGFQRASVELAQMSGEELRNIQKGASGIHRRFDVEIRVDSADSRHSNEGRSDDDRSGIDFRKVDDEVSLTKDTGHPRSGAKIHA
ncbi:uncharacterized protein DNG_09704 [Cephalotrichum gorgonifer]|uniref:Uncharacterized protein n=1 Tax=Cephalotrichum gorgonifer TaxID=2041049 RepID=A0AAE8N671_9PEZI|nr:uncharacterized protein DNG_09704 [Cephalotrichum gorgonifer]